MLVREHNYVKVKSTRQSEGLYKEEASAVLISCTALEKTERTCCNVTDSTGQTRQILAMTMWRISF